MGGVVEADETYIGRKPGRKMARGGAGHKLAVFSLVERDGNVRSVHITGPMFDGIKAALNQNVSPEARLMTDPPPELTSISCVWPSSFWRWAEAY